MNQTELIIDAAKDLIKSLKGVANEEEIKKLTIKTWKQLKKAIASEGSLNRARTTLRKMINEAYPISTELKPGYYYTQAGKGKESRYEHLALWYLTVNESRWEIVGDEARNQYWGNLPELPKPETKELVEESKNKSNIQATEQIKPETKSQPMSIEQLQIDSETKNLIVNAAKLTGVDFSTFVAEACKYYAKTIVGKAKQIDEELTAISTDKLLKDSKYSTHPGRPEELVRRAIQAIKIHNGNATEKSQKWFITQSLLMQLTGSRADKIKPLISEGGRFSQEVNDVNSTLIYDYALDEKGIHLFNRKIDKRKPEDEINLCELVPDGI